jgi:hypothetical protein
MRFGRSRERDLASFADGRVWRLTRGRHFNGSVRAVRERLEQAAKDMDKVVRIVPDKLRPDRHVWVQFGDASIDADDPCICGSRDALRLHRRWSRCTNCGRLLHVNEPKGFAQILGPAPSDGSDDGEPPTSQPKAKKAPGGGKALDAFDEVALYRYSLSEDVEQCFGLGRNAGAAPMLLSVRFPLEDGHRIPHPHMHGQWYYTLGKAPIDQFGALIDLSDLEEGGIRVSWRIDEDAGPQTHERLHPAPG